MSYFSLCEFINASQDVSVSKQVSNHATNWTEMRNVHKEINIIKLLLY